MSDGTRVSVSRQVPRGRIRALVQFCHGMAEHSARYDRLGSILAEHGYVFSIYDQRGHGKTAEYAAERKTGMFGSLADKDGFRRAVDDLYEITERLLADFPGRAVMLIGHSFGSFVAQSFIERYGSSVDACVLCGTAGPRLLLSHSGRLLVSAVSLCCGRTYRSRFVEKMTFGSCNSRIEHPCREHDWLSRDASAVEAYEKDPWCGFTPTTGFFHDLLDGLCTIHTAGNIKRIPHALPVLLMCGDADPIGAYGTSVLKLYRTYKTAGMGSVGLIVYPGARH